MALSTGVAHPCDMDCRQVAFSFATLRGPEGLTVAENGRGIWRDQPRRMRQEIMKDTRSLVSVVDDDESVRESLPDLLKEFGFAVRAFDCVGQTRCLILDIAMPGMTGPGLQQELKRRGQEIPIVFITAQRDEAVRSRMLEQGAVECLFKPFSDTALLQALNLALRVS
jgi:CheY-like chemotaxis protein